MKGRDDWRDVGKINKSTHSWFDAPYGPPPPDERHPEPAFIVLVIAIVLALAAILIGCPSPKVEASQRPDRPHQQIAGSYAPLVEWNGSDQTLTVTDAMPRGSLICIRGVCKLQEEWVGR